MLNPHLFGLGSEFCAGALATELARFINPGIESVKHLPALSSIADKSSGEHVEEYMKSKREDKDEFFFSITEHSGDVAMLLIDKEDQLHINGDARTMLEKLWRDAYKPNIKRLLPDIAGQLHEGYLFTAGVKYTTTDKTNK